MGDITNNIIISVGRQEIEKYVNRVIIEEFSYRADGSKITKSQELTSLNQN
jgi:hypothetical protein